MKKKLMVSIAVILLGLMGVRLYFWWSMATLQTFALQVLQAGHPDWRLERSGANGVKVTSGSTVGHVYLNNIQREAGSDRARARELLEQSARNLNALFQTPTLPPLDAVKSRLRPVLVPRDYANQYELAARPFAGDIVEVLVIDGRSTRYLRSEDLKAWQTELAPLLQPAEAALWRDSQALKLEAKTPADPSKPGKFLALATLDGYDAARLAVREMRAALAAELGYPYYVAVPNRDFLVAWSKDYAFAEQFAQKARRDFGIQSYPLSPSVYRVEPDAVEVVK